MNVSEWLDLKIKEQGRSQKWIAEQLNINYSTLTSYGKKSPIPLESFIKISILLDLDLEEIKELQLKSNPCLSLITEICIRANFNLNLLKDMDIPKGIA